MGLLDNLVNSVNQGIGKAMEKVNAAAQEANAKAEAEGKPLTEEEKEKQAQALDALKGLGGMFSGAVEMAKKEMQAEVEAKAAAEAAIFDGWEERFPYYPKWDVGGDHFELEEMDPMNGHPSWRFCLRGRPFLVELYAQKLRAAGFVAKGNDPMDLNADTLLRLEPHRRLRRRLHQRQLLRGQVRGTQAQAAGDHLPIRRRRDRQRPREEPLQEALLTPSSLISFLFWCRWWSMGWDTVGRKGGKMKMVVHYLDHHQH